MPEPVFLAQQVLNGLSFGALLFLLASGLTLVFGLMRIVNMAHGAFYMLGGYIGVVIATLTGNLLVAVIAAIVAVGVTAFLVEVVLLRFVRGQEMPEVLLTIGVSFVIADLCLAFFGGDPQNLPNSVRIPGALAIGDLVYPWYRIFVIGLAVAIGVALALVQSRTRVGAIVRAGVDDREIISAMGVNIRWVFTGMFVVGAALAAIGGTIGAGMQSILPGVQNEVLLYALVVIIIGGLGSVAGAAVGSVLIGLIDAFAKAWIPELAYFTIFLPMALVLVFRPTGLFGKAA
ncbi:branched-chain amino acid ABC transporter permease [Microbacterium sp. zg-Y818]|uniref:branched-chain amino acid ABC transporter permease n=1 Tax=unclassified Microbacterium TaxID=2609290 RepID=UPI00214C1B4D|nr:MULTISPECIES: branched-chain amino acid ABC transporter permease [unclassified Microbacterium]MCR2799567.1 branched-chain amino acid ABC transporter permease [Microbacterium sp. zg.Y818]WIM21561.1 branched-chain amino acid ABC transporter permease [Microbacterium sp. zg-Y818]